MKKQLVHLTYVTGMMGALALSSAPRSFAEPNPYYQPPKVPQYYEEGDGGHQQNIKVKKNYLYVEGMGSLGQSRISGSSESARLSFGANLNLGYVKALGSWSHLDSSLGILTHKMSATNTDLSVPFGLMANLGYGYSIYGNVSGVFKGGVGVMFHEYSDDFDNIARDTQKAKPDFAMQLAYLFVFPVTEHTLLTTGVAWTGLFANVDEVKDRAGTTYDIARDVNFHLYEFKLGLRTLI